MKHNGKYIAYYRVSTDKQKVSGLGRGAQEETVRNYLNGGNWKLVATFTETESGKHNDRPELAKALAMCRVHNATLIVAKLDRLARNAHFLKTIVNESGEAGVVFCDLPKTEGPAGKFLIGMMAEVAELEAGLISQRTKAALAVAKKNGKVLGRPNSDIYKHAQKGGATAAVNSRARITKRSADFLPILEAIKAEGNTSLRQIAAALNERGIATARGKQWTSVQVLRLLKASAPGKQPTSQGAALERVEVA
jgi:DNA invertase Pin-like site-specific DNA recombinase